MSKLAPKNIPTNSVLRPETLSSSPGTYSKYLQWLVSSKHAEPTSSKCTMPVISNNWHVSSFAAPIMVSPWDWDSSCASFDFRMQKQYRQPGPWESNLSLIKAASCLSLPFWSPEQRLAPGHRTGSVWTLEAHIHMSSAYKMWHHRPRGGEGSVSNSGFTLCAGHQHRQPCGSHRTG